MSVFLFGGRKYTIFTYLPEWFDSNGKRDSAENTEDTACVDDDEDNGETHGS